MGKLVYCKCGHLKSYHNTDHKTGESCAGSCIYGSITCGCEKFVARKTRRKYSIEC